MDNKEREYFHSIMNKLTAIDGKLRKVTKLNEDEKIAEDLEKLKTLNSDLQDLLIKYREHAKAL